MSYFSKMRHFSGRAAKNGKKKIAEK